MMNNRLTHKTGQSRITLLSTFAYAVSVVLFLSGCGKPAAGESEPSGQDQTSLAAAGSTVHSHDNPDETCFICDPAKRDQGRLWCAEHGRYEDRCWLCHPELEDKERLYCTEHFLFEDECFLCHPELASGDQTSIDETGVNLPDRDQTQAPDGLYCHEHDLPEIECAICQPDLAGSLVPGQNLKIRFPSMAAAEKAGIRTGQPQASEATPGIEAFCEAQYNLNTMARVTPLAGGVIRKVLVDVGDQVAAGDVLVELHSAEVAATKSAFLSAIVERDIRRQAFEREGRLKEQNIAAEKDFLEADAAHRTARLAAGNYRQKLINLGLDEQGIAEVERMQDTSAQLLVRAPFDGTLVERDAFVGEMAEAGGALFTIADLSTRWLALSIPSSQAGRIRLDQSVEARFPELPGVTVHGRITWVDTSVDARSRMVRARAVVTEGADRVRNGLFGEARIATGDSRAAAVVPRDAIQRHEGGDYIFVRNEPDLFSLRRIELGPSTGESVEVLAGLDPDDAVVMDGSFIVMSEFLKSRLGAGCADH